MNRGVVAEKDRRRENQDVGSHQGALGVASRTDRRVALFPETDSDSGFTEAPKGRQSPRRGEFPSVGFGREAGFPIAVGRVMRVRVPSAPPKVE
jgi:hypothetical protein